MSDSKNNNSFSAINSIHSQSQVGYSSHGQKAKDFYDEFSPFSVIFENVKDQIEFECFSERDREAVEDICLIIAEVLKLPPNALVRIAGNNLPAEMVQTIYHRLLHEHIKLVVENFGRAAYEIRHIKTYLRTALYNSVFEINAHYQNAVHKDFPELVNKPFGMQRGEK